MQNRADCVKSSLHKLQILLYDWREQTQKTFNITDTASYYSVLRAE